MVTVPSLNPKEASVPGFSKLAIPPGTLYPPAFKTNQTPTLSVPPLQPIPTQMPTPTAKKATPVLSSSPVIEFGQVLPISKD